MNGWVDVGTEEMGVRRGRVDGKFRVVGEKEGRMD
jgi:hypothetical protein